jgi:hypothetical protein
MHTAPIKSILKTRPSPAQSEASPVADPPGSYHI